MLGSRQASPSTSCTHDYIFPCLRVSSVLLLLANCPLTVYETGHPVSVRSGSDVASTTNDQMTTTQTHTHRHIRTQGWATGFETEHDVIHLLAHQLQVIHPHEEDKGLYVHVCVHLCVNMCVMKVATPTHMQSSSPHLFANR